MRVTIQSKNGNKEIDINRRKAAREKCLNCSGWSYTGVENCEFKDCELYPFRMGTGKQNAQKRHKSIRDYCLNCCAGNRSEVSRCSSTDCSLFAYRKSTIDHSIELKSNQKIGHIKRKRGTLNSKGISQHTVIQ